MTWDYFVDISENVRKIAQDYHRELKNLEDQLKHAQDQHRNKIRDQIKQKKQELRELFSNFIREDVVSQTLVSPLVDYATVWFFLELPRKDDVRTEVYIPLAQEIHIDEPGKISDEIDFRPGFEHLASTHWLVLQVDFELLTPWYSKDDRLFHVLDNPVRKDRVFGVPFMAASSWKGVLRWACRMQEGLLDFLKKGKSFEKEWKDPAWILHLFGNEKGEEENFRQGALVFYPTWFDKIGFEVINPHSRERRAGTQPIYYEVVLPGAKGTLSLLYAPWPGMKPEVKPEEVLSNLLEAIEVLLTAYGISAKRTVGWGAAKITTWHAFHKDHGYIQKGNHSDLWEEIQNWLPEGGVS